MSLGKPLQNFYSQITGLSFERKMMVLGFIVALVGLLFGPNLVHQIFSSQQESQTIIEPQNSHIYTYSDAAYTYSPPTPKPEIKLSLGQTATSSGMQITVYSAQKIESYNSSSSSGTEYTSNPAKGNVFVIVDVGVKNVGSNRAAFDVISFYLRDSDANTYHDLSGFKGVQDAIFRIGQLLPDEHKRGHGLFEIPSTAKDLKLYYEFSNYPLEMASWSIPN
jgi:hypothetical protein